MLDVRKWAVGVCLVLAFGGRALAWGAIAIDDPQGWEANKIVYGVSLGQGTRQKAQAEALADCQKKAHRYCRLQLVFQGCGAFASSPIWYAAGAGVNRKTAEQNSLHSCGNPQCMIVTSQCESGSR